MQKSAITELDGVEIWRSEIEARMALNDYDSALALAQSTLLKEDRLHLLAVIAKTKRKTGLSPEPELKEQIRELYNQIDQTTLGKRAIEIASDLIYSAPDLAIELVEKSTTSDRGENALDWAFAALSLAALNADQRQDQHTGVFDNIRLRIKDPAARRFSSATSVLLREYSAAEIIAETEKLEGASNRLYLLRHWCIANRERNDAFEVVDYALKLTIRTTDYSPNARALRELAAPLPFILDVIKLKQFVGIFDSQKGAVECLGPTDEYIRLQLLLAQAESKYDFEATRNRVNDVYLYIGELDDLAIKSECLARLMSSLTDIDSQLKFEERDKIHTLTQNDLKSNIYQLLSATAKHYHASRGVIRALAKSKPEEALALAMTLNTEDRRDLAIFDLIESAIQAPINKLRLSLIENTITHIVDPELQDTAILEVIERLCLIGENVQLLITDALPFINRIENIQDASEQCRGYCLAYCLLKKHGANEYAGLTSRLLQRLNTAWQAIDVGWYKVKIGFKIVEALAAYSTEIAQEYLVLTEKYRDEITFYARPTAWIYLASLRLTIRAYSGLLPRNLDTAEDIESIRELIDVIPSNIERVGLWADLALRCYLNRRSDDCKRIVDEHIKPLLQPIQDTKYKLEVIIKTAPALYCAHKLTTLEQISALSKKQRDEAYEQICEFILRKQPPLDPYDTLPGQGYDVSYEEILDICEILGLMDADSMIYRFIKCISDSVASRRPKRRFSRQQQLDIVDRLQGVINNKFPNPRYIKHDGYKIAAQAQIARIQQARTKVWEDLIQSARNITNLADRAFVLCIIAVAMPTKESSKSKQILEEAIGNIKLIPANLDRIERYEAFADMTVDVDSVVCRECLQCAMKSAVENSNSDLYSVQRRIINLAYRLDPNLAASLASFADDDPAREGVRANLKKQIQILELKKRMTNQLESGSDSTSSKSDYPLAAWKSLGALNAGRAEHVHFEHTRDFIQIAANLPLSQSYPILAWVIENANRRFAKTDQARTLLRPIYEATILGSQLAARMATRPSIHPKQVMRHAIKSSDNTSILIQPGDRERAIQFLKDWFTHEVKDYLKICDEYFGPEDLEVLQLLRSVNPSCKVHILTSRKHQNQEKIPTPWEDAYRTHWRIRISDQDPPDTNIVIVGTESSGKSPIHDRWWLTNGGGISIGTSFNSLGFKQDSNISVLTEDQAEIFDKDIDQYLQLVKREYNGERLHYTVFTL